MANMEKQSVLSTEDYNNYIGAGDLTEEGIVFVFDDISEYTGRFEVEKENDDGSISKVKKPYWVIRGFDSRGMDISISTGSVKLHRMIMDNYQVLKGEKINLSGRGKNFDREYRITILR